MAPIAPRQPLPASPVAPDVKRGTKRALVFLLLITPAILGAAAYWYLPRSEVPRDDFLPDDELIVVAFGMVEDGGPDHRASGNVTLYWNNDTKEWFLYFQGYDASRGWDTRFFLTQSDDPRSMEEAQQGLELRVPDRGTADVRGTFMIPIPEGENPLDYSAVVAWEMRFDTRHSVTVLEPV